MLQSPSTAKNSDIPALRIEKLTKYFGSFCALDELDLTVACGEVIGCLGPNGAGKTTTIRLLLGLLRPSAGKAWIDGHDVSQDAVAAHEHVAYVPGETALWPNLTGFETLVFLGNLHKHTDVAYRDELIERFELDHSRKVSAYSKGNRQKVSLIAGLMTRADLLILDEPTSGLDPLMEAVFRQCIQDARERGQTVFLSSHTLSQVEAVCDRVAILRSGRLVEQGKIAELKHLGALKIDLTFAGKKPSFAGLTGVQLVDETSTTMSLHVKGDGAINDVMRHLSGYDLTHIISREPSLEEVFLAHYGEESANKKQAEQGESC